MLSTLCPDSSTFYSQAVSEIVVQEPHPPLILGIEMPFFGFVFFDPILPLAEDGHFSKADCLAVTAYATVGLGFSRTGTVLLRGTLGSVSVSNQGTGVVYVAGATQRVDVDVGGTGTVVLDNANGESLSVSRP